MTKRSFIAKGVRVEGCLDLIHIDICGTISVHARGGYEYFITFTDDYSRGDSSCRRTQPDLEAEPGPGPKDTVFTPCFFFFLIISNNLNTISFPNTFQILNENIYT